MPPVTYANSHGTPAQEMAWITAKKELKLDKLRSVFIDSLQVERILLYGFKNGRSVSSFRTARLTERQKKNIAGVHELIQTGEEAKRRAQFSANQVSTTAHTHVCPTCRPASPCSLVFCTTHFQAFPIYAL